MNLRHADPCPICGPHRWPDHQDDSYGGCVICREYVPHTDVEYVTVAFPCPAFRLAALEAAAPSSMTGEK